MKNSPFFNEMKRRAEIVDSKEFKMWRQSLRDEEQREREKLSQEEKEELDSLKEEQIEKDKKKIATLKKKRERKKRYVVVDGYPYEKNKFRLRAIECFNTKKEAKEFRKDLIPIQRSGSVIKAVYCEKDEFEFDCKFDCIVNRIIKRRWFF